MKPKTNKPASTAPDGAPPKEHPVHSRFRAIAPDEIDATCTVTVAAAVVQAIHRHARGSMQAEVCGVLIGDERPDGTLIEAAIPGENAAQGGAHVTFTQDTWEHIYSVKDRDYPEKRIVGWYHSHPGFGIFLSRHDAFIHENFFSAPFQVAWVYDPHSEDEGCFGWMDGKLRRLPAFRVIDTDHLNDVLIADEPDAAFDVDEESPDEPQPASSQPKESALQLQKKSKLQKKLVLLFSLALVFVAGLAAGILLLPRTLVMYSLPDGRILSEAEMRVAVERAMQLQKDLQGQQSGSEKVPGAESPAPPLGTVNPPAAKEQPRTEGGP